MCPEESSVGMPRPLQMFFEILSWSGYNSNSVIWSISVTRLQVCEMEDVTAYMVILQNVFTLFDKIFVSTIELKRWFQTFLDISLPKKLSGHSHHPIEIVIWGVYCTIPFGFSLFRHFLVMTFQLVKLHVLLRITDDGSVPEMRIWSISLI